jgi:cell division protein FtsZ
MRAALDYKLLEEDSINGAKGAIINVTGSEDMPLGEVEDAIRIVEEEADDNADIIWGTVFKPGMEDEIKVTVIATGFDSKIQMTMPHPLESSANAAGNGMAPIYTASDVKKQEDMNVPTFIRRQAD